MRQNYKKKPSQSATAFKTDQIRLMRKDVCYGVMVSSLRLVDCPMRESITLVLTCAVRVSLTYKTTLLCKPCKPLPHHLKYRIFAPNYNCKKECSYYE